MFEALGKRDPYESHLKTYRFPTMSETIRNQKAIDNIGSCTKETTTGKSLKNTQLFDNVGNYKKSKGNHRCPTISEVIGKGQLWESH